MNVRDRYDQAVENFKTNEVVKRVKLHFTENKDRYVVGVSVAGITWLITRGVASQSISVAIGDAATGAIGVSGKRVVMRNVSFISSYRQGPPSWVVRCLETNKLFLSQRSAETEMGLTAGNVSKQILGLIDNANGYHFERVCIAG